MLTTDRIKCKICKKYRNAHAYSKRQLDIFRHARVVEGQRANNVGYASCRNCTGGQVMELRCCVCDQIKGLDDFAINQRKEHELAVSLSLSASYVAARLTRLNLNSVASTAFRVIRRQIRS